MCKAVRNKRQVSTITTDTPAGQYKSQIVFEKGLFHKFTISPPSQLDSPIVLIDSLDELRVLLTSVEEVLDIIKEEYTQEEPTS